MNINNLSLDKMTLDNLKFFARIPFPVVGDKDFYEINLKSAKNQYFNDEKKAKRIALRNTIMERGFIYAMEGLALTTYFIK